MAPVVRISAASGKVRVTAEDRPDVHVQHGSTISTDDGWEIEGASSGVEARVPFDTDLLIGTASGSVTLTGRLGSVGVTTASGDVTALDVDSIDARTSSGRLDVTARTGEVRLQGESGKIRVRSAGGDTRVSTKSGRVIIDDARGAINVHTVSGKVSAALSVANAVSVDTVSGGVVIEVPRGCRPSTRFQSTSGKQRLKAPAGEDMEIAVRTVSGNLTVSEL